MSKWDSKIDKAEKFLEKAQTHGQKVYKRYKDDRSDDNSGNFKKVNLFYSNVNTLKESLFNSMPKPEVSRVQRGDRSEEHTSELQSLMRHSYAGFCLQQKLHQTTRTQLILPTVRKNKPHPTLQ